MSIADQAQQILTRTLTDLGEQADPKVMDWPACNRLAAAVDGFFESGRSWHSYRHPYRSHCGIETDVPLAHSRRGSSNDLLVCAGGIANAAQRFDFLAKSLAERRQVVALDWAGRGRSGWLIEAADYGLQSYVDQLAGLIERLDAGPVDILGSSIGGSAAICLAARRPDLVKRLILNDSGAFIAKEQRARRADKVARHYVFTTPRQLFRRTGAAQKNVGPVFDAVLLHTIFNQTRWSDEETGRIYRHDLRALIQYRAFSQSDLDLWDDWQKVRCPVLVVHGLLSDTLTPAILKRMHKIQPFTRLGVADAGHTPALSSASLLQAIAEWLDHNPNATDRRDLPPDPAPDRRLFVSTAP